MNFSSQFDEEMEALQAIYMDDLIVNIDEVARLQMTLHPSTADEDDKKFVCLTLVCSITKQYPEKKPSFDLKNPRGLSDAHLASIKDNLEALAGQKIGEMMVYDLLEYARGSLTDNNHPSCVCPICLDYFKEDEGFFRTECYHYFHFPCIQGYVKSVNEKHICPVCRLEINGRNVETILNNNTTLSMDLTSNKEISYTKTKEYKKWLAQCKVTYDQQKQNGGIIDLDYERNKYLVPSVATPVARDQSGNQEQGIDIEKQSTTVTEQENHLSYMPTKSKSKHKQGRHHHRHQSKQKPKEDYSKKEHDISQSSTKKSTSHHKLSKDKSDHEKNEQLKGSKTSNSHHDERPGSSDTQSRHCKIKQQTNKRQSSESKSHSVLKGNLERNADSKQKPRPSISATKSQNENSASSQPSGLPETHSSKKNISAASEKKSDQTSSTAGFDKENTTNNSKSRRKLGKNKNDQQHKTEETSATTLGDSKKTGTTQSSQSGWAKVVPTSTSTDSKGFPSIGSTVMATKSRTDNNKGTEGGGRCEPKPPPGFERKKRPPPGFKPI